MERFTEGMADRPEPVYDLLVIGGGITGAAVAYDAARRGLTVALVEKQDFGCATSAATSKLIHGGFRYLANLQFGVVRESLRERRILEDIAPNFVYPLPCVLTAYGNGKFDRPAALRVGMGLYDLLSFDKKRTRDPAKALPSHRMVDAEEAAHLEPVIKPNGLLGAALYWDCQNIDPERLSLAFIRSAVKHGAQVANYARVEHFLVEEGRVQGAVVRDMLTNRTVEVKAALTVNSAGPWADLLLGLLPGRASGKKLRRSEGIHLVVKKRVDRHLVGGVGRTGSHFFMIPWRGHTLVGITDTEYLGDPDDYRVTRTAMEALLDGVNSAFVAEPIVPADVVHVFGGLRPLVDDGTEKVRDASRRHEVHDNGKDGFEGLLTVTGGKFTTSRHLADAVLKRVGSKLGRKLTPCSTADERLAGCEMDDVEAFVEGAKLANPGIAPHTIDWLARHYGTDYPAVLELGRTDSTLLAPLDADGEIAAQALYAVHAEMARTLADVVLRRTGFGTLGWPGDQVIGQIAEVTARALGWDQARTEREVLQVRTLLTLPTWNA